MSTADPPVPLAATGVGLGYGIAIAVSILVLISTIMLASYVCVRFKANGRSDSSGGSGGNNNNILRGRSNHQFTTRISIEPVVIVMGLDGPNIESYPKMVLGESRRLPKPNNGPCSICLSDYQPKDTIRCIPECHHCFHANCIDQWLQMSATCPLCRNSPAPSGNSTPLATPLSELVPLAFHARGPLPFYKVIKWGLIWTTMKRVSFLTGSTTMKRDGSLMKCSLVRTSTAHGNNWLLHVQLSDLTNWNLESL